jgi:hypothetical protein
LVTALPGHVPARAVARETARGSPLRADRRQQRRGSRQAETGAAKGTDHLALVLERAKGTSGPISEAWHVGGWPTIYVLDGAGVIRYRDVRGEDMDRAVDQLLSELETQKK